MKPETSQVPDTSDQARFAPLVNTIVSATIIYLSLIVLSVISVALFFYQFQYEVEPGIRFIDEPGGVVHVWAHALRAVIGAVLALAMHRYLSAIRAVRRNDEEAITRALASIARWWRSLAAVCLCVIAFGVWAVFALNQAATLPNQLDQFSTLDEPEVLVEFRLAEYDPADGLIEALTHREETIWLHSTPVLTNQDIAEASVTTDPGGEPAVSVEFTAEGEEAIRAATKGHIGRPMAILVNDRIISAPTILWEIGKSAMLNIRDMEEAERIARALSGRK